MAYGVFANISTLSEYKQWYDANAGLDEESPFGPKQITLKPPVSLTTALFRYHPVSVEAV